MTKSTSKKVIKTKESLCPVVIPVGDGNKLSKYVAIPSKSD
jgi:hypothetical protein